MRRGNAKKIRHAIRLRRVRGGGKPFRHAVPLAETFRSRPPCAVVNRETAQDHQEQPGVPTLGPAPWGSDARITSSRAAQFLPVLFVDIADLKFGRKSMKQIKTLAVILKPISGSIHPHSLSIMAKRVRQGIRPGSTAYAEIPPRPGWHTLANERAARQVPDRSGLSP